MVLSSQTPVAIVHINRNDFWMTSDAGYRRPSTVLKGLRDVKLSYAVCICIPDLQPVRGNYDQVVKNLEQLQAEIVTPGYQIGKGFFLGAKGDAKRFKIQHVLFDVSNHAIN